MGRVHGRLTKAEIRKFARRVNAINAIYNPPDRPDVLYHYTDFAGLHGMLKTDRIWATYNKVLNDATEEHHAIGVLDSALKTFLKTGSNTLNIGSLLPPRRRFVSCFCESDSLLSMWRAYAGDGGGYCLGFSYEGLRATGFLKSRPGSSFPLLGRVAYGDAPRDILAYLKADVAYGKIKQQSIDELVAKLSPFLPSMIKNVAFREEREWRLIALDPPTEWINFRSGNANIKPYVELACVKAFGEFKLPLVSVTYGPRLRREDRPEEILNWMLEKYSYPAYAHPKIEIRPSIIPYRI